MDISRFLVNERKLQAYPVLEGREQYLSLSDLPMRSSIEMDFSSVDELLDMKRSRAIEKPLPRPLKLLQLQAIGDSRFTVLGIVGSEKQGIYNYDPALVRRDVVMLGTEKELPEDEEANLRILLGEAVPFMNLTRGQHGTITAHRHPDPQVAVPIDLPIFNDEPLRVTAIRVYQDHADQFARPVLRLEEA